MPVKNTTEVVATGILSEDADQRSSALQLAGDLLRTQNAEPLKHALFHALQQEKDLHRVSGLIWAMGKSSDPQFIELYRNFLRKFIGDRPEADAAIYQTLIALDNCGEPVFERDARGRSSESILNVEKNLRQAETYLANLEAKTSQ